MVVLDIEQLLIAGSEEELELNRRQFLMYVKRKLIENNINLNDNDGRLFTMVAERSSLTKQGYVYNTEPKLIVEELGCSISTFYRILKKYRGNSFGLHTKSTSGLRAGIEFVWEWGGRPI